MSFACEQHQGQRESGRSVQLHVGIPGAQNNNKIKGTGQSTTHACMHVQKITAHFSIRTKNACVKVCSLSQETPSPSVYLHVDKYQQHSHDRISQTFPVCLVSDYKLDDERPGDEDMAL